MKDECRTARGEEREARRLRDLEMERFENHRHFISFSTNYTNNTNKDKRTKKKDLYAFGVKKEKGKKRFKKKCVRLSDCFWFLQINTVLECGERARG